MVNLLDQTIDRKHRRTALVKVLVLVALCTTAGSSSAAAVTFPASPVAGTSFDPVAVDRFITAQMARHRIPGIALAITQGTQVVHVRGYGTAHDGEPVTGQTPFRIASLSKAFTAMAVLRLVEGGRISLDAPIKQYLPSFELSTPSASAQITVRQLLNHTSGLADTGFVNGLPGQETTLAGRITSLRTARAVDAAGAAFHYFDPNYQALARLVEAASGEPFDIYLQRHVFAPLAMHDSFSTLTATLPIQRADLLAQGHIIAYGMPIALSELSGFLGGSGGVVSTASDMAHHLSAQNSHGQHAGRAVLSDAGISIMQTPPADEAGAYAMGWTASQVQGVKTIEHNGVLSTFYAEAVLLPESGYGFVLLYNAYALSAATLTFPEIKSGMISLLTGTAPVYGKVTLPWFGRGAAALSLLIAGAAVWSLLRLRQWKVRASHMARWRLALSVLWPLLPALVLLGLPRLLALQSGRYFDHVMLARAIPELIILLGVCAVLGVTNSVLRAISVYANGQTTP